MTEGQDRAEEFDEDVIGEDAEEDPAPPAPEESAVHAIDETLGGFDSEVDDPALEDAWELDPEVER